MQSQKENTTVPNIEDREHVKKTLMPVYSENAKKEMKNIYKSNAKVAFLTFDDGPSQAVTPLILDLLKEENIKATFFVLCSRISGYSDIVRREAELGMEIGNHSYSHSKLNSLSRADIVSQKNQTDSAVKNITGTNTTVFRPPYGSSNQTVSEVFNMPVILWSIDTLDWKTRNTQSTIDAVMNNVKDGDIILMHDIYEATANAAVQLIPMLIDDSSAFITNQSHDFLNRIISCKIRVKFIHKIFI